MKVDDEDIIRSHRHAEKKAAEHIETILEILKNSNTPRERDVSIASEMAIYKFMLLYLINLSCSGLSSAERSLFILRCREIILSEFDAFFGLDPQVKK